ncbi:putative reverse transcriptase domain-containing protein [Tanacetum coccineum]|uniref:Reverse transcriptase domain-containing protein n=1 Tax=Tanacetum coccineum TaxID=301880 RepID=A0ABQ5EFZ8_9ASTR
MLTAWRRVEPLPTHRLAVRHSVNHSLSDYFSPKDLARDSSSDSSSEASSDFHSDASSDSSLRHSLPDHSSLDLPSTSAGPSYKRHRSPMAFVPALSPVSRALSHARADLIPSPKRIRDSDYLADVEVDSRESFESSRSRGNDVAVDDDIERVNESYSEHEIDHVQATIEACFYFANIIRSRGIDMRVVAKTVTRDEIRTDTRDIVKGGDDKVTHPVVSDDVQEAAQEDRVAEGTYETLGSLREQGRRNVGVESVVTALTNRIAELESDNRRLRGITRFEVISHHPKISPSVTLIVLRKMPNTRSGSSMAQEEIEDLVARRVAEEMEARKAAMNLEPLNERNGENGNGNGGRKGNGNRNVNQGMNNRGFMPVARECTFQDFLKCKPHNFLGTEGVDSALTWWNSHKRIIGVDTAYAMKWAGLMKLMTEVYCPRNKIQKMETELWNLTVKGNDLTAYTQRFQELILLCTRMVPDEDDRVERFIGGLPDNIQRNVIAANLARL